MLDVGVGYFTVAAALSGCVVGMLASTDDQLTLTGKGLMILLKLRPSHAHMYYGLVSKAHPKTWCISM